MILHAERSLPLCLGLTLLLGGLAVPAGAEGPVYLRRLEMQRNLERY